MSQAQMGQVLGKGALKCNDGCNNGSSGCTWVFGTCSQGTKWYLQKECDYHVFATCPECKLGALKTCAEDIICNVSGLWSCTFYSATVVRQTNECAPL